MLSPETIMIPAALTTFVTALCGFEACSHASLGLHARTKARTAGTSWHTTLERLDALTHGLAAVWWYMLCSDLGAKPGASLDRLKGGLVHLVAHLFMFVWHLFKVNHAIMLKGGP